MKNICLIILILLNSFNVIAESRLHIYSMGTKDDIKEKIEKHKWAADILLTAHNDVDKYVQIHQKDPEWIISRLQMYWKNKYTTPYLNGGYYSRAEGKAPVPTVRFTGSRDWATDHAQPKIEDIKPYMDYNDDQVYLQNIKKPGKPWEWVDNAKSAHHIEMMNVDIMNRAMYSAFLYWMTNEDKYARFSSDILLKYIDGMYYRKAPITEIDHRNKDLIGISSFEVIHEKIVVPMTLCYDFIYPYLLQNKVDFEKIHNVFQKFADQIIKNGVPENNWNIFQARFITYLALCLEDDNHYQNKKGKQYYIDQILNQNSRKQKALRDVCKTFDQNTGIWNESAGYSVNVSKDLLEILLLVDGVNNDNILKDFSIVEKAVWATFEYLFPNNRTTAFGDGGYSYLPFSSYEMLLAFYKKYKVTDKERFLSSVLNDQIAQGIYNRNQGSSLYKLFNYVPEINPDFKDSYNLYSSVFYASNVNLVLQRNGMDKEHGLMCVNAGTGFNHNHNNAINMELYGKGAVLAPDLGAGRSYWVPEHREYYSQPVCHNTVIVDGISANGSAWRLGGKRSEAHKLLSCYPLPNKKDALTPSLISYVDNSYLESKTNSLQRRVNGIIRIDDISGYYVDIYRSHRQDGKDKMHDYFYHNLGNSLLLKNKEGQALSLKPTTMLSSKLGDAKGYDYFKNKYSCDYEGDFSGVFRLNVDNQKSLFMNFWMKGDTDREIFSVQGPRCLRALNITKDIDTMSIPAFIVRQKGEAWTKPFVAVYEPSSSQEKNLIQKVSYYNSKDADFVGIKVQTANCIDYILNTTCSSKLNKFGLCDISMQGIYGFVREKEEKPSCLFMGVASKLNYGKYSLISLDSKDITVFVDLESSKICSNGDVKIQVPYKKKAELKYINEKGEPCKVFGTVMNKGDNKVVEFIIHVDK